jgi:hypothetical protein
MSKLSFVRRAGTAVVATALAASVVVGGGAAQAAPADHGADWLSSRLTDGVIVDNGFPSYGLTIDTAFALKAIGGHRPDLRHIRTALQQHVNDYISGDPSFDPGGRYAGPTAKLLVAAQTLGADPRSFGGVNLVRRLNRLVTRSGPAKGRIADQSTFGDFANTVGQILAVRGLTTARSGEGGPAQRFLLE